MATRIEVEGLEELRKALRKADKATRRELTKAIKGAAKIVADEAKRRARSKGLAPPGTSGRATGQLVRSIKPFAKRTTGGVRVMAQRDGFAYPVLYEYAGPGRVGPRPFVTSALEDKADDVAEHLEDELVRILRNAGL